MTELILGDRKKKMNRVLRTKYYNNGYMCACCHAHWDVTDWVNPSEMITKEEILKQIDESDEEYEGEIYEWDGEIIGGYHKPHLRR